MQILKNYKNAGLIPFNLKITPDKTTGKKVLEHIPAFLKINKYDDEHFKNNYNGYAIRTGTPIKKKKLKEETYFLIGVDIDIKDDTNDLKNGMSKWEQLTKDNNFNDILSINTPIQKTANNGYHYLFKATAEELKNIGSSITGLIIDDIKYSIDVKATNQFLIVEPSNYDDKCYKWIKAPKEYDILLLPRFIYDIILKHHNFKDTKDKPKIKYNINNEIINNNINISEFQPDETTYKLINMIDDKRYDNYDEWLKMGAILKFLNIPFNIFNEKSKTSKKYDKNECIYKWNSLKISTKIKNYFNCLRYYSKLDNPEEYNILYNEININKLSINEKYERITINNKYLLKLDNNLNDDNDILTKNINEFINDDNIKSLNIKSAYGTGKTQLLKKILNNHNYKRILWLSYRVTYTDDILNEFQNFGFGSYLKREYKNDKLIIQLESLMNLDKDNNNDDFIDDEYIKEMPQYDLIIIDEIESILNQFDSSTFKGKNKDIYEYLYYIIKGSKKIISLDGDMNNRALNYISQFGEMKTIINEYNENVRTFILSSKRDKFNNELLKEVDKAIIENKKICLCSMSKSETIIYNKLLLEHNDKLRILLINGDTGDDEKKLLQDIKNNILNYDIFIYSPSIEAGVNIDIKNCFNKLFCILSDCSASQRSFLQMTARIRHLNDNNILILNECFKLNKTSNFWNYDDVEPIIKYIKNISSDVKYIEKDNKIIKVNKINSYDNNYIYNQIEKLNKNKFYFLPLLKILCIKKGINFIIDETENTKKTKKDNNYIIEKVINSDDINDEEYQKLIKKQNNRTASTQDKLNIKKHSYKNMLGVDKLNIKLFKQYYNKTNTIYNYCNLIDIENVKKTTDNKTDENIKKASIINNVINQLGYNNIFDNKEIIEEEFNKNLEIVIKQNEIYTNQLNIKTLFHMPKLIISKENKKQILGYINSLLHTFNLSIKLLQKRIGGKNKTNFYKIEHLNNIDEIIFYKIEKGYFKLKDKDNLFKPNKKEFIYNELHINNIKKDVDSVPDYKQINDYTNLLDINISFIIEFDD